MGCLLLMFGAFFPRLAVFFIWLARPIYFEQALGSAFVAILGILFLPFTTLMYVLLWTSNGLSGWDWLWIFLAFLIDIGGLGSSAWGNRDRAGGFYSGGSTG
jgi:hypothetical protein